MPFDTAVKCDMCGEHDMVPVPGRDGTVTSFKWCPNCDSPEGVLPTIQ